MELWLLILVIVLGVIGLLLAIILIVKCVFVHKRSVKRRSYPKDVVILHQFPRGYKAPSQSPFVLKLETWLRMAGIKYQNEHAVALGPKGKAPWITLNGIDVADSQFCIEYLAQVFDKDLSKNFSELDQACARAFMKMNEESTVWPLALQRFVYDRDPKQSGIPKIFLAIQGYRVKKRAVSQGYGRHEQEEVYSIGRKDLKSLNTFIGNKRFLLGDQCCNEDASLFGMICQYVYHETGPLHHFIMNDCPNIVRYIETIKSTYWPDWNDCITYKRANIRTDDIN